jgi:1,6-anhydro-N-acetylmuramate kinase
MDGLLLPVGYATGTKMAGTEIAGVGVDPISDAVVAPNSQTFPSKAALRAAANASIAAGKSAFGLSR